MTSYGAIKLYVIQVSVNELPFSRTGFFRKVSIIKMILVGPIRVFERAARARDGRFETLISFIIGGIQGNFGRQHERFIEDH